MCVAYKLNYQQLVSAVRGFIKLKQGYDLPFKVIAQCIRDGYVLYCNGMDNVSFTNS
jgi:hypothetical protein